MLVLARCGTYFASLAFGYFISFGIRQTFSTANEFQILMGTALHVRDMVEGGLNVPPQVLWSEFLMLIPQQLLPVEKIDPSFWYLIESGLSETGSGYMFWRSRGEAGETRSFSCGRGVSGRAGAGFVLWNIPGVRRVSATVSGGYLAVNGDLL